MDELLRRATASVLRNISVIGVEEFALLRQAVIREHGRRTIPDPCEKCFEAPKGTHIPSLQGSVPIKKCCCGNCYHSSLKNGMRSECEDCPWRTETPAAQ